MGDVTPSSASTLQLLERYDRPGPRYASYPTAVEFHNGVRNDIYVEHLARMRSRRRRADLGLRPPAVLRAPLLVLRLQCRDHAASRGGEPLSRCGRAGNRPAGVAPAESPHDRAAALGRRHADVLHAGAAVARVARIARHFTFTADAELGVEIDPRVTTIAHLDMLRSLGFNRLSMGVQDFDPTVQEAINRIQSYEMTRDLLVHARDHGFGSINIDLIYGLPHQTPETLRKDAGAGVDAAA